MDRDLLARDLAQITRPGTLLGWRKDGRPIYLAGGGDGTGDPPDDGGQGGGEGDSPAPVELPFTVPDDIAALSDDELVALAGQARDHGMQLGQRAANEHTDESIAQLRACRDLATSIRGEQQSRAQRAADAAALAADLDAATADDPGGDNDPDGDGDNSGEPAGDNDDNGGGDPAGVTAGAGQPTPRRRRAPSVRQIGGSPQPQLPQDSDQPRYGSLVAAAAIAGHASGDTLPNFDSAARLLAKQMDRYPQSRTSRRPPKAGRDWRPIEVHVKGAPGRRLTLRNYHREQGVEIRREFPAELRVAEDAGEGRAYEVAEYARRERNLPGGSLREAMKLSVKRGRALTAAAGWCAPSEILLDLCELETLDGMLDVPEMQASRGGFQIPEDGGPDFSTIFTSIGNAGDTHLTEAEVIADTTKVCTEVPCPDFDDVRLGVDYYCLTGSMLQRRGYPEVVARFARGAEVALMHKINAGVIAEIVAGSGAAVPIPQVSTGDDAVSSTLSAVDLAIWDIKYRHRMGFNATIEVVMPAWFEVPIRAALARRRGVLSFAVSDAEIMDWFTTRNAVPRFVYDWQDAFTGLANGPGGAAALTALPTTGQFLAYPAGTWVKAVQDVVSLDTIYDSTLLSTNQYTAIFTEDAWALLKMCPDSRLYQVPLDPSGVVGCCPPDLLGS